MKYGDALCHPSDLVDDGQARRLYAPLMHAFSLINPVQSEKNIAGLTSAYFF